MIRPQAEMARVLLRLLCDGFMIWTGEVVLSLLTFGQHTPRWRIYNEAPWRDSALPSAFSFWVGVSAWILAIAWLAPPILN